MEWLSSCLGAPFLALLWAVVLWTCSLGLRPIGVWYVTQRGQNNRPQHTRVWSMAQFVWLAPGDCCSPCQNSSRDFGELIRQLGSRTSA